MSIRTALSALIAAILFPCVAAADSISDIHVPYASPAYIYYGWEVEVAMNYTFTGNPDDEPRISVIPLFEGEAPPGAWWDSSSISPGSGRVWPRFTINRGPGEIDALRVTLDIIHDTLLQIDIPVGYVFGEHGLWKLQPSAESFSSLPHSYQLHFSFNYGTSEPSGILVNIRPMSGGTTTPHYVYSDVEPLPPGTGASGLWFAVIDGEADVDQLRIRLNDAGNHDLLLEYFVPCSYHFGANAIYNITMDPEGPQSLLFDEYVWFQCDYVTDHWGDIQILMIPLTDGVPTPNSFAYPSAPFPTGSGHAPAGMTVHPQAGPVEVNGILCRIRDAYDHELVIHEFVLPAAYHYDSSKFDQIAVTPNMAAILSHDAWVQSDFYVQNNTGGSAFVTVQPYSQGMPTSNIEKNVGPTVTPGYRHARISFRVTTGSAEVDEIGLQMWSVAKDELLAEYRVPARYFYGPGGAISAIPAALAAPARPQPLLRQNAPNPFNPSTTIRYELPERATVSLRIYDLAGRLVRVLRDGNTEAAGEHRVTWDGCNENGRRVASGAYICRLESGGTLITRRMMLVQ
jgi:hypothetical protein